MNLLIQQKISRIKSYSLKLYSNSQIPSLLAIRISHLNADTPKYYIDRLMIQVEKYMRVKGYYKKYPQDEKQANLEISKGF